MKYLNVPLFLISLVIGFISVWLTNPDKRIIYVYPTPDNVDILQYKDRTNGCFQFTQKEVQCPSDEKLITKITPQT